MLKTLWVFRIETADKAFFHGIGVTRPHGRWVRGYVSLLEAARL